MIIGIIAEGSYPYISGGVSSWLHQLISGMPNVQFKIFSIMASSKEQPEYKYKLPSNILEVKTIFMDQYLSIPQKSFANVKLSKSDQELISQFVDFNQSLDWDNFIKLISDKKKIKSIYKLIQSKPVWESFLVRYNRNHYNDGFNSYFWTIRSIIIPLLFIIQEVDLEADVYHTISTGYAGIVASVLKAKYNKPLLLTEHGIYAREREEELLAADWVAKSYKKLWIDFFYFISKGCYDASDVVISLFYDNKVIQEALGVEKEKLEVINNGVSIKNFNAAKVEHTGYNVASILRVVPIKDVLTMLRSFRMVLNKRHDVHFFIIGPTEEDEDYYEKCVELVNILDMNSYVTFTGKINIKDIIHELDVLVLTSISEGQPLVILEGLASAIPFVSTDVGACRELLEDDGINGTCGIITKPVSPNETSEGILKLLENDELRNEYGENGRKKMETYFKLEDVINKYESLYNKYYN
ncbi:MAG: GT4 family glycosyltransferase PelF [Acidaminobacteraceae bacterium]